MFDDDWRYNGREIKSFFSVDLLEGMKKNVECQTILPVGGQVTDVHIAVSVIDHRKTYPKLKNLHHYLDR